MFISPDRETQGFFLENILPPERREVMFSQVSVRPRMGGGGGTIVSGPRSLLGRRGTPEEDKGTPSPGQDRVPHQKGRCTPPDNRIGGTPPPHLRNSYAASGMPLALTLEDCLVKTCLYLGNLPPTQGNSESLQIKKECKRIVVRCFCDLLTFVQGGHGTGKRGNLNIFADR